MHLSKLRNYIIVSSLLVLLPISATSQFVFQKTFGSLLWDDANSVQVFDNNTYMLLGSTAGGSFILTMNSQGDTLMTRNFVLTDGVFNVKVTDDNNLLFFGYSTGFSPGKSKFVVLKTDTLLNIDWVKSYGDSNQDFCNDGIQTINGDLMIVGRTQSFGPGFSNAYVLRTNSLGELIWSKTLGRGPPGDFISYHAYRIIEYADLSGYLVLGSTDEINPGYYDSFIAKIDSLGNVLWLKTIGSPDSSFGDAAYSVAQTENGNFVILAVLSEFTNGSIVIINCDPAGNILWSKSYGNSCGASASSLTITDNGDYVVAGSYCYQSLYDSKAFLMRVDSNGSVIWAKSYASGVFGGNIFKDVKHTPDGGMVAIGTTGDLFNRDIYVVKTDANGNTGCEDSTVNIVVTDVSPLVSAPTIFFSSGCTVDSVTTTLVYSSIVDSTLCSDTMVGVQELLTYQTKEGLLDIYPNPVQSYMSVKTYVPETFGKSELIIYNMLGIKLKKIPIATGYNQIIMFSEDFPDAGVYFVTIRSERVNILSKKMIISK